MKPMRIGGKPIIFLMACLLGAGVAFLAKNMTDETGLIPFKLINDYSKVIEKEQIEVERLRVLTEDVRGKIDQYRSQQAGGGLEEALRDELAETRLRAGVDALEGPGVLVILSDGDRPLLEGEDPNNLLIHDIDVLNIVNDLKVAGAEAVSINGQRMAAVSEISCAGPTIMINDQVYAQPFIIKAIGDPDYLQAAVKAPGTYGNLLKQVGLFIEANTSVNVKIAAFSEPVGFEYSSIKGKQVEP